MAIIRLALFALFSASSAFGSEEFIVSYKALVKNQILLGEEYSVAKALTQSKDYKVLGICEFVDLDSTKIAESRDSIISRESAKDSIKSIESMESIKSADSIESMESMDSTTLKIIKNNKDFVLDCLHKNVNVKLRDDAKFINNALDSSIKLQIPPQRILVDLESGKITLIEKIL